MGGCTDGSEQHTATPTATDTATNANQPHGSASAGGQRIDVVVGHCFVETIRFDGERWNVPFRKQFGGGGGAESHDYRAWEGSGTIVRTGTGTARYVDDGGEVLELLPIDHPAVRKVEHAGCR